MFDFFSPEKLQQYAILAPGLLMALVCHEVAHGFVAYLLGDPTAKSQGRLTLNPLKHLDPLGTLAFFFVSFGWAKPVPVDARYFRNPRQGMLLTAIAGPGTNFVLAALCAVAIHVIAGMEIMPGSTSEQVLVPLYLMFQAAVYVNLILGIFNMIPIPPLDGSNVLAYFLPPQMAYKYMSLSRYGFVILIGIIILSRYSDYSLFGGVILPMVQGMMRLFGL